MCDLNPQRHLPLSKHQSWLGLSIVVAGGRAADEHGGATVTAEGVLQDAGHFAVTVRHVSFLQDRVGMMREGDYKKREKDQKKTKQHKAKELPEQSFICFLI